ncbi:hypothetical protein GCK72_008095 [Caenorhabditis remanei]|uniref:Uncharacterized protein n=1 Tax=Caenorhabditis remanei TaxID=31234 RepID=A0A6A5HP75_CAERE|nr:hypothetical protein GCK72_008095 [Caenorhabditis remanei]KAF1768133.1 hypothetical protein GCK72_008095 [Caenorhabditis remanei]
MASEEQIAAVYQQKLWNLQVDNGKIMLESEKTRSGILKDYNYLEIKILEEKFDFRHMNLTNLYKIMKRWSGELTFDEFRIACLRLARQFQKFQKHFVDNKLLQDGTYGNLKLPPPTQLLDAVSALQNFSNSAQNLQIIIHEDLFFDYQMLQKRIIEKSNEIQSSIQQFIIEFEIHRKNSRKIWNQVFGFNANILRRKNDLEVKYIHIKSLVSHLEELVKFLYIPMSRRFDDTIATYYQSLVV